MTESTVENDASSKISIPPKRILVISALFPPNVIGGAEMSASNLSRWLAARGHDVAILTTATTEDQACEDKLENGLRIWRVLLPRQYQIFNFPKAPQWQKPIWHFQDHFDVRNRVAVRKVLEKFQPDFINIHYIQGIGYNALDELSLRKIQVTFFTHDLGLACVKMSMFKGGKNCVGQCFTCKISSHFKYGFIRRFENIRFVSPSQANIDKLNKYLPIKSYPNKTILNPNAYPPANKLRRESNTFRILYVGRLHFTKGVNVILEAVDRLIRKQMDISLTMIGAGPDMETLKERYVGKSWCTFTGFIPQQQISDYIVNSEIMCTPSIWAENSPGVVIHALSLGLPVIGSNAGGIPELIEDGRNGSLLEPGNIAAWTDELERLIKSPEILAGWRAYAAETAWRFDQDYLGKKVESFMFEDVAAAKVGL